MSLFSINDQYSTIANVKDELVFVKPDHSLRYNFVTKNLNRVTSNEHRRHLRYFKGPNGQELELLEEEGHLTIKHGRREVLAYPERIQGDIREGSISMAKLHEYATGLDIEVAIVTYEIENRFVFLVIDWDKGNFLCKFRIEIPDQVETADFFFENIFADAADVKYIKGSMIENEKVVYDLTLVQVASVKDSRAEHFIKNFPILFANMSLPVPPGVLSLFKENGVQGQQPSTLEALHENFQRPIIDAVIREGRVNIIESALRQSDGTLSSS